MFSYERGTPAGVKVVFGRREFWGGDRGSDAVNVDGLRDHAHLSIYLCLPINLLIGVAIMPGTPHAQPQTTNPPKNALSRKLQTEAGPVLPIHSLASRRRRCGAETVVAMP